MDYTFSYPSYLLALFLLYFLYRWYFKGITFTFEGKYDKKLKNIGKTLPPYPNGWFVAMNSKDLHNGQSNYVDVNGENLVLFRSTEGKPFALQAYCAHLGANLGAGGQVVNKKCIQCPFHGWLYDGQTGLCVNHDGKPVQGTEVEYNDDFCHQGGKINWKKKQTQQIRLRKYPLCQVNNLIYVWIHAMPQHQQKPIYPVMNFNPLLNNLQYRAELIHHVSSHAQDIPENGADLLHFKFVHKEFIPNVEKFNFVWHAKWKRGDDPDIKEIFHHEKKQIRQFKEMLYQTYIQKCPQRKYISVGYIDNYLKLPIIGKLFFLNITTIQIGSSMAFIFIKSPFFTIIVLNFVRPREKYQPVLHHQIYSSKWLPYWFSALMGKLQGIQVTNDMKMWDLKTFKKKMTVRKGEPADDLIIRWREWFSQHYEGCYEKEKNRLTW